MVGCKNGVLFVPSVDIPSFCFSIRSAVTFNENMCKYNKQGPNTQINLNAIWRWNKHHDQAGRSGILPLRRKMRAKFLLKNVSLR